MSTRPSTREFKHARFEWLMSLLGHSRPMHLVPVPINVRCYSNSNPIVRRSEVTLRATTRLMRCSKQSLYSITLSARARKDSGMVSPSALAVFRLTTRSNLVGCSTGRSSGLMPRRTLTIRRANCP